MAKTPLVDIKNANQAVQAAVGVVTYLESWAGAVDNTANGQALATIKAAALNGSTAYLRVRPEYASDDVRYNPVGNASGTSARLPADGIALTIAQASTAKFFCTAGANIMVDEI